MIKKYTRPLIWLWLLTGYTSLTFAQGFQVNLAGQKQIAMGGTGTGFAQDGATIFFNPGGLSLLKNNSISLGVSPLFLRVGFAAPAPSTYRASFGTVSPPVMGYAVFGPKKIGLRFGIGVTNPFGGSANWGNSWQGKYALEKLDLKATFIQPTVGIRISPRLGIGGGFVIGVGTVDLQKAIPLADSASRDGQARLKGDAIGYGFNVGIYYQATDAFSIGISYRSKVVEKTTNGEATFTVPKSLQASFPSPNTFTNTLPLPAVLSIGLGYRASRTFSLAADLNFIQWSVYKTLEFTFGKTTPALPNSVSVRNYKDAFDLRLGGQYTVLPSLQLRAGLNYGATAIRDGYVTPETPDANRIGISSGLGYEMGKHFVLDVSFLYESIQSRTQKNLETGLSGTFKTNVYIPGLAITYRF